MFKKKIAAMVAAMMTISSLTTVAFAANGDTIDKLLGNALVNGTFENGVGDWGPTDRIMSEINITNDNGAGSARIMPGAADSSPVHAKFKVTANKYYHAEAYVKLVAEASTKAELVIATINGTSLSTPVTTTAVATDVNGTAWTKLECDFVSEAVDLGIYVELEEEQAFYLDDVIVNSTNYRIPGMEKDLVSVADKDGKRYVAMKLTADNDGAVNLIELTDYTKETLPVGGKLTAKVMLDKDAQSSAPTAKVSLQKKAGGVGYEKDETFSLRKNEMIDVILENTSTTRYRNQYPLLKISGAQAGDIIYFCGIVVEEAAEETEPAAAATAEITSLEALSGEDTSAVIVADANTVALRYFYSVKDENGIWKKIKTGHTNAGVTVVPPVRLDSSYAGKSVKLEIEPLNSDCIYGAKDSITATVKAPFERGEATASAGTITFDVGNYSGGQKNVAALVAYYNDKDEMVGIGIQNKLVDNNDSEEYTVSLGNGTVTDNYKIFILDGTVTDSVLALFPLAEAK